MEHSISSLAFQGSITEAIVEARRQKKLFVVYISGDNPESTHLEKSTWTDLSVAESISKYCILLHIPEGSSDAVHFSAIYPQKSVPCITVIGHNGVQVWQNDGFVSAEVLSPTLEKAWLSLHIQETTATFLTAALTSKKSEKPASEASEASDNASLEQGSSSRMDAPSPSTNKHVHSSEARPLEKSEVMGGNKACEPAVKGQERNPKLSDEVSPGSVLPNELDGHEAENSSSSLTETAKESHNPVKVDRNKTGVNRMPFSVEDQSPAPEENTNVVDHHSGRSMDASQVSETVQEQKAKTIEVEKTDVLDFTRSEPNDVHLNIRLLDGASLQEKFSVSSTLRMVKDYVDENQENIGSYDLAIPYPRKVFNNQDLSKSLLELGLFNRQALIVVPHHRAVSNHKGGSSLHNQTNSINDVGSSNGSTEGYFAFVRRVLSYVNPFSYLGGDGASSNSAREPQSSMSQYSPNPSLQSNLRGTGRPYTSYSPNQSTHATGENNSRSRPQTSSRLGSNIHTLRHDEDDSRFGDRNAFWNGNSTQYGGDNDGK